MTCGNCGKSYGAGELACPYCRASSAMDGLARIVPADSLDRWTTESLLSRCDADAEALLARDLGGPLAIDELRSAVGRIDRGDPSVAEIETALAREATVALDGIALSELVDAGGADVKMIRRGLTFLKTRRWADALEWWSLHRDGPGPRERRLLLLLVLEAFTHRLAGDRRRAADAHARIAAHPLYRATRGVERR